MIGALRTAEVGRRLLDGVIAGFTAHGVQLPERRFLAPSTAERVAHDDEQVTVALAGITSRTPGSAQPGGMLVSPYKSPGMWPLPIAEYEVQVVRCVPAFEDDAVPAVASMDALGSACMVDAGVLAAVLTELADTGKLLPAELPLPHRVGVGAVRVWEPRGGLGGVTARVTAELG